jgi:hypothetical protein
LQLRMRDISGIIISEQDAKNGVGRGCVVTPVEFDWMCH